MILTMMKAVNKDSTIINVQYIAAAHVLVEKLGRDSRGSRIANPLSALASSIRIWRHAVRNQSGL